MQETDVLSEMKNIDPQKIDRDALVDICDVHINTALPKAERAKDFIRQIKNPYCFRHGKHIVLVGFADTDISLQERLIEHISHKV